MLTATMHISGSVGPVSINGDVPVEGQSVITSQELLNIASAGTLSTRTSDTEGTLTLTEGHGMIEGEYIDIYWDGGRRYDCLVGVVAGNDVPFSGGAGDILPAEDSALTAAIRQIIQQIGVDADWCTLVLVQCKNRACIRVVNAENVIMLLVDTETDHLFSWWADGVRENPGARGEFSRIFASQAGVDAELLGQVAFMGTVE